MESESGGEQEKAISKDLKKSLYQKEKENRAELFGQVRIALL